MQFYATVALLAALTAPLATAQDLSQLPACALTPAISSITGTGCSPTDIACVCKNTAFLSALQPVIAAKCSADDLAKALSFAQSLCSSAGVPLNIPAASSAAPAPVSSAPAPASSAPAPASSAPAPASSAPAPSSSAPAAPSSAAASSSSPPAGSSAAAAPVTSAKPTTTGQAVVSVISDGQPQVPTGVSNITINSTIPSSKPPTFPGAASSVSAHIISVAMLVGAVGVFVTL